MVMYINCQKLGSVKKVFFLGKPEREELEKEWLEDPVTNGNKELGKGRAWMEMNGSR